jgi:hypothetical protein
MELLWHGTDLAIGVKLMVKLMVRTGTNSHTDKTRMGDDPCFIIYLIFSLMYNIY